MGNDLPRPHDVPRPQWGNDFIDGIYYSPSLNAGQPYSYGQTSEFFSPDYVDTANWYTIPVGGESIFLAPAMPGQIYEVVVGPFALDSYFVTVQGISLNVVVSFPDGDICVGQIPIPDLVGSGGFPGPIVGYQTKQHYDQQAFIFINPDGEDHYLDELEIKLTLTFDAFGGAPAPGGYIYLNFGVPRYVFRPGGHESPEEIGFFGVRGVGELRNCVQPTPPIIPP